MDLNPSPSLRFLRSLGVELTEELVLAVPDQGEEDQFLTLAQHPRADDERVDRRRGRGSAWRG